MATFPIVISDSGTVLQFTSPCGGSVSNGTGGGTNNGPFVTGAATRYLIGLFTSGVGTFLGAIKSTDFGVTWAITDQVGSINANDLTQVSSVIDADGVRIWAVFITGTDPGDGDPYVLNIAIFNTGTDTWGSVLASTNLPNPVQTGIGPYPYRLSVAQNSGGNIVVVSNFYLDFATFQEEFIYNAGYIIYNAGWGSFTQFPTVPSTGTGSFDLRISLTICAAGAFVHCFARHDDGDGSPPPYPLYHQALSGASLGTLEIIAGGQLSSESSIPLLMEACYDVSANQVHLVCSGLITVAASGQDYTKLWAGVAANGSTLALSLSIVDPELGNNRMVVNGLSLVVFSTGVIYTFIGVWQSSVSWIPSGAGSDSFAVEFAINNTFPATSLGSITSGGGLPNLDIQSGPVPPAVGSTGYGLAFTGSQFYWETIGAPPPPSGPTLVTKSVGGGAQYFPRAFNKSLLIAQIARIYGQDWYLSRDFPPLSSFFLFPNQADLCLSREFILYDLIDREAMSCAKKPNCFLANERDWQDSPPGWRTFNPVKAIPLPASTDGDVVIFSFRVPYGYDGVITAQYHGYTLGFTQGSGDIAWRVRADGRYLRDAGNMVVSLGNPKQLSPVYGGLQLRSGNLVEYVVSAPNISGLLPPPGTGNILAGLHGLFYPRM